MSDVPAPLQRLGLPEAAACEGDACLLPAADDVAEAGRFELPMGLRPKPH